MRRTIQHRSAPAATPIHAPHQRKALFRGGGARQCDAQEGPVLTAIDIRDAAPP
jgi:hypothetical protein